ncbi:hypothetical protein HK096_010188, partial [Nowakowskiella sp. JEL0078]
MSISSAFVVLASTIADSNTKLIELEGQHHANIDLHDTQHWFGLLLSIVRIFRLTRKMPYSDDISSNASLMEDISHIESTKFAEKFAAGHILYQLLMTIWIMTLETWADRLIISKISNEISQQFLNDWNMWYIQVNAITASCERSKRIRSKFEQCQLSLLTSTQILLFGKSNEKETEFNSIPENAKLCVNFLKKHLETKRKILKEFPLIEALTFSRISKSIVIQNSESYLSAPKSIKRSISISSGKNSPLQYETFQQRALSISNGDEEWMISKSDDNNTTKIEISNGIKKQLFEKIKVSAGRINSERSSISISEKNNATGRSLSKQILQRLNVSSGNNNEEQLEILDYMVETKQFLLKI